MGQIKVTYDLDGISGLCTIESTVHGDNRGWFMETFSQKDMYEAGLYISFVQDIMRDGESVRTWDTNMTWIMVRDGDYYLADIITKTADD